MLWSEVEVPSSPKKRREFEDMSNLQVANL
jgi:hypothetical protein